MKCSEQLLVAMPWGEHRLFGRFLHSNVGKLQLKIVSAQVVPSQVTHNNVEKVCKIINEDCQSTILEITGRLGLSYGTHENFNRGLEHVVDLHEVCASSAYR
jgi:hypothetical protein